MSLSINELTTYKWSFDKDVMNCRAAGIGAIGVWRPKLADYGEQRGIELLADAGVAVSNLLWAGGFTGSDGHTFRESLADAADAIRLAGALKAEALVVYSGARNGHTNNHARRLFTDALKQLLLVAADHGVTLAIEPMCGPCAADWTLHSTLDESISLVEEFNHPRLKLVFDTYHMGHDPAVIESIRRLAPHVAVVHLSDATQPPGHEQNRCRLGSGTLPLREMIAALVENGYDGFYDVELFGEEIETCDYQELIQDSKQFFEHLTSGLNLSVR